MNNSASAKPVWPGQRIRSLIMISDITGDDQQTPAGDHSDSPQEDAGEKQGATETVHANWGLIHRGQHVTGQLTVIWVAPSLPEQAPRASHRSSFYCRCHQLNIGSIQFLWDLLPAWIFNCTTTNSQTLEPAKSQQTIKTRSSM